MSVPHVIFLDAVGTLFHTRGSVGKNYAQFLAGFKIDVSEKSLDQAFRDVFKASPQAAFGLIDSSLELARLEKEWWYQVVWKTLGKVIDVTIFLEFDAFFEQVYDYFATASAWSLFPEVIPALENWTQQGIQLGVISNFDSRLLRVLHALEIEHFFQSVTLSSHVGVAKPHPLIFRAALSQASCDACDAIHIGDQFLDDYQGAIGAGMRARWLNRDSSNGGGLDAHPGIIALDQLHW